jgi:DNA invertase Pin-like site-specific DNA recombinase
MMRNGKYVVYYRVSTDKQNKSGLGLEAQAVAVKQYLNGGKWQIVGTFTEAESGKRDDRPALAQALAMCRIHNATLIVAKLDRLARNTKFLLTVVENSGEAGVVFCDLPAIPEGPTGKFLLTQMASVAELEAGLISQRTKAALQAAKAAGTVLGCRNDNVKRYAALGAKASASVRTANAAERSSDVMTIIEDIKAQGATSLRQIAKVLTERGIPTARHNSDWSAAQVSRVLARA